MEIIWTLAAALAFGSAVYLVISKLDTYLGLKRWREKITDREFD